MRTFRIIQKRISLTMMIALLCLLFGAVSMPACSKAEGKPKKKKAKVEEEHDASADHSKDSHAESESNKQPGESHGNDDKKKDDKEKDDKNKDDKNKDEKHSDENKEVKTPDPNKLWAGLMGGNKLFMKGKYNVGNILGERSGLAKGEKPNIIILGCSDSRVPPELVFGENTGDLFVVRNAGSIVDELALGSMEYAVEQFHSSVIVVLGHESCGAVAAAVEGEKMPTANLRAIVEKISPAFADSDKCEVGGKMNTSCVELNVQHTAKQLISKSSVLRKAVDEGHLTIFKAIYKLDTGEVARLE